MSFHYDECVNMGDGHRRFGKFASKTAMYPLKGLTMRHKNGYTASAGSFLGKCHINGIKDLLFM